MWKIEYTKRFLKELSQLPKDEQERVETIVFEEMKSSNPFGLGYVEKMSGYTDKYKVRVGNYRIGLTLDKKAQTVICERVAHRKEIYRIFP
jgi:mRNA interferase RelE/StbE